MYSNTVGKFCLISNKVGLQFQDAEEQLKDLAKNKENVAIEQQIFKSTLNVNGKENEVTEVEEKGMSFTFRVSLNAMHLIIYIVCGYPERK